MKEKIPFGYAESVSSIRIFLESADVGPSLALANLQEFKSIRVQGQGLLSRNFLAEFVSSLKENASRFQVYRKLIC